MRYLNLRSLNQSFTPSSGQLTWASISKRQYTKISCAECHAPSVHTLHAYHNARHLCTNCLSQLHRIWRGLVYVGIPLNIPALIILHDCLPYIQKAEHPYMATFLCNI